VITVWRLATILLLVVLIGVPVLLPLVEFARQPGTWSAWRETAPALAWNTIRLVAGMLVLALPTGIIGAILLYRTDLPLRRFWRFLTLLMLFVPLPFFASAWQATLGTDGLVPSAAWTTRLANDPDVTATGLAWKPWAYGLGAATWIHAVAAFPWAVLLVGQGLRWVEPELEEEALLSASPTRVLTVVTLPRIRAVIAAAALWIALQALTEITISDMMQVRTFAEEVYYQFVLGEDAAVARGVAINLPIALLVAAVVLLAARRVQNAVPALEHQARPPAMFPLGAWRWPAFALVVATAVLLVGVPVTSLVWKSGVEGGPFDATTSLRNISAALLGRGGALVARSVAFAALAGLATGALAFIACWFTAPSRFGLAPLLLAALVLALPGPIIGLGLKATINLILDLEAWLGARSFHPAANLLYHGPSPVPLLWVTLLRFFPFALAVLWPVVHIYPRELREAAAIDGATPPREFFGIALPILLPSVVQACLGVAVLSLGEVSAGKLVETPGSQSFAHDLFNQMHYGVQARLAALCLVLLLAVTAGGVAFAVASAWIRGTTLESR
jgi:iron(III) transport system permease protein